MDIVEQFKKDVAEDGCGDVGPLLDEIERLRAELAKQQSLTEAALQVAESAQRSAAHNLAAAQAREKTLREKIALVQSESCACGTKKPDARYHSVFCVYSQLAEILDLPADDTALREMLAQRERETIERCATAFSQWDRDGRWAASVIRALEVK